MTSEDGEGADESGGRDDRLLPWRRVKEIAGISRTTAWRMQKAGDFPDPVPISPKRVGWWESELTAWKASRKAEGRPKPLVPPRRPKLIETARSSRRTVEARRTDGAEGAGKGDAAPAGRSGAFPETAPVAPAPKGPPFAQGQLPLDTPDPAPPRSGSGRRRRAVSPDQIDFGF